MTQNSRIPLCSPCMQVLPVLQSRSLQGRQHHRSARLPKRLHPEPSRTKQLHNVAQASRSQRPRRRARRAHRAPDRGDPARAHRRAVLKLRSKSSRTASMKGMVFRYCSGVTLVVPCTQMARSCARARAAL